MRRSLLWCVLVGVGVRAAASDSLDAVLTALDQSNPEIQAARAAAAAAAARADAAGAWPNPSLGYAREKTPAGERLTHLRAGQEVPFPGKRTWDARMARHQAAQAAEGAKARALSLRAEARGLYVQLARSRVVADRLAGEIDALSALEASLRARLATTGDSAADLFSLEVERGRLANQRLSELQNGAAARLRLNALLDRPWDAPLVVDVAPALKDPPPLDALLERARRQNPLALNAMHEQAHAQAQRARARLAWAPDLSVMYDQERMTGGGSGREVGLSLSVPLWVSAPGGENREARWHEAAVAGDARAAAAEVTRAVRTEHAEVSTRLAQARAYEAVVLPAARSAWELSRRRYASGRADFTRLMEALRARWAAEVEYQEALAGYAQHWGFLEQEVGSPLEEGL